ncbi:glycoside hydrolase family 28 protein [Pinibacter soli]|uniref:Glycosyl hydrolase family 28 protein n=1 Tax=Pinibacter soli TaxID=3044211 RepID=A0ABT6R9I6_9BACT|nr:glycosyl hydrolase family 28 protein [Pinibacter soli]MDI3319224.1 glycosyl hydrolase family 28 protein [Pinibacter soli]
MEIRSGLFAFLLAIAMVNVATAQYTKLPSIADKNYPVTDFGAVGDGSTLNTKSIQSALDKASANGGCVVIPAGVFLCGPLTIGGKTALRIEKGAVLRLRNDVDTYPAVNNRYLNFINISGASDVKICGEGTIDGQGEIWWKKFTAKEITNRRPQMVFIENAQRLEISGITFLNPPNTHLSIKDGTDVYIHGIRIVAPANSRNTDGINISAKNCTIEDCDIRTGDDNIAINFGNRNNSATEPECSNIVVKNCFFGVGHGMSIGSFTSGGLKNLSVSNCKFDGTTSAIRIKTARGRGGLVENVSYSDIDIKDSKWPIFISEYYPREPDTPEADTTTVATAFCPVYKNIALKNITVTGATDAIKINGIPESPIQGIIFENVKINAKNGAQIYNAKQVKFVKCRINVEKGEVLKTYNAEVEGM